MIVFEKTYDGESIVDLYRDVSESIDAEFNPLISNIPVDKHGFQQGTFKVLIEWVPPEVKDNIRK